MSADPAPSRRTTMIDIVTPRSPTNFRTPSTGTASSHRVSASIATSSHYASTRRHSLYGTEDRIIIDLGSRVWKVGFSGEGKPRDVFCAGERSRIGEEGELWGLERATGREEREEEDRVLEVKVERCLRAVFHESLITDPKSRKVIIIEHPLLPLRIKDMMARILFNNLQVPSISFASSHLLALLAAGKITGLVLDCGHLESVALPIFSSRPLHPHLRTTPLAGSRLTHHLRALLLLFGTYLPPPTSLSAAVNIPQSARSTRVPLEVLTERVVEDIKTRACFVGGALDSAGGLERAMSPAPSPSPGLGEDEEMEGPTPSSDAPSTEPEAMEGHPPPSTPQPSGFSTPSHSLAPPPTSDHPRPGENHLQALATMYTLHSTAPDLHIKVTPPPSQNTGTGMGTLIIPGWVRERAAEVLFEGGDVDEGSVVEVVLEVLLKVPLDLRKTLASSILIIGGTSMLPGFIPRLQTELVRALLPPPSSRHHPNPSRPQYDRYAPLRPLAPYFSILNNPTPPANPENEGATGKAGRAPPFTPSLMAWVGGSLAGALKTGGPEVLREKWDEAEGGPGDADDGVDGLTRQARSVLPDWTRAPMSAGAPVAPRPSAMGSSVAPVGA